MIQKLVNKKTLPYIACFVIGSALTYVILDNVSSREYEKTIERQREQISLLETKVHTLQSEMTRMSMVTIEEFSEQTGQLIRRENRKDTETENTTETKTETKIVEVEKEVEKIVEKEKVVKEIQKNHIYAGVGLTDEAKQLYSAGYMRTIGIFNIGVQVQSTQDFEDKAILGTVGISF